jgi:hypothetical protein
MRAAVTGLALALASWVPSACGSSGTAASRHAQARDPAPAVGEAEGAAPIAATGRGPADFCCKAGRGTTGQRCELITALQVQGCLDARKFQLHCTGGFVYDGSTARCLK